MVNNAVRDGGQSYRKEGSKVEHSLEVLFQLLGLSWSEFSDVFDESAVVNCPYLIDKDVTGLVELPFGDVYTQPLHSSDYVGSDGANDGRVVGRIDGISLNNDYWPDFSGFTSLPGIEVGKPNIKALPHSHRAVLRIQPIPQWNLQRLFLILFEAPPSKPVFC